MVANKIKRKESVGPNTYVHGVSTGLIRRYFLIEKYGKSLDMFYSQDRQLDLCCKHIILVFL